jgi:polyhydroxyalkanoate synthesis repressor PhaR
VETKPDAAATTSSEASEASDRPRRVIKRYSNRKLYDTKDSRYVTLLQIAEMVRAGEDVQIIDNNSKEDLTEVTLAQIIYEEQKAHSRNVPLQTLKELIHSRTEKVLSELREGPIGRLIPGAKDGGEEKEKDGDTAKDAKDAKESKDSKDKDAPKDAVKDGKDPKAGLVVTAKETLEDWQHKIDERIKAILPSLNPWQQLQNEVKRLTQRLDELEKKLKGK